MAVDPLAHAGAARRYSGSGVSLHPGGQMMLPGGIETGRRPPPASTIALNASDTIMQVHAVAQDRVSWCTRLRGV